MDGLILLAQARTAGLTVTVQGDKLVIRGPRRAGPLAAQLLAHKTDVLEALDLETVIPAVIPDDLPADWHFLWDERAAIMEHDGQLPRERAEALALADIFRTMERAGIPVHYHD